MTIDLLIQARLGSTRLPRKVLAEVAGKPLIRYLIDGMKHVGGARRVVVLLPRHDNELIDAVRPDDVWLGDEHDVASRFVDYLEDEKPDAFVRVCGDSPVLDWRIVAHMLALFDEVRPLLLTNVGGGFPPGQHVEICDTTYFLESADAGWIDREHVLPRLYDRTGAAKRVFGIRPPAETPSLVVDTAADLARMKRVIELADGRPWQYSWRELQQWA